MVVVFEGVLSSVAKVFARTSAGGDASELEQLRDEAVSIVEQLPRVSAERRSELLDDIDVFSAPVGGMSDVLRAMIRLLPSHYEHDIAGAALVLGIGREHGADVSLTPDEVTGEHVELYSLLERAGEDKQLRLVETGTSKRSREKAWVQEQKDICFAMDHLDEYPMLLPIVRDRGVTDVRQALETARVMSNSGAKPLSSGLL